MKKTNYDYIINFILAAFFLALIVIFLTNCNPVKKVLNDPKKFEQVAQEVTKRGYCVNDTVIKTKSDTLVTFDTTYLQQFSVRDVTDTLYKTLPGNTSIQERLITKTLRIYDTITNNIRDTKLEGIYKTERDQIQGGFNQKTLELNAMTGKRNYWRTRFFGLLILFGVAIFLRIKRIL